MTDFKTELDKLIAQETTPLPDNELVEILKNLNRNQNDISLQVEEIYDTIQSADSAGLLESLSEEKRRTKTLVNAVVGLCDVIEDFHAYATQGSDEVLARQALMMWKNTVKLLDECGMSRVDEAGGAGQALDPEIHAVRAAAPSGYPKEHVARVLRSGYRHMGTVVRKAAVIISSGTEDTGSE